MLSWEQECALVAQHQAGDPAAATALVRHYDGFLRRWAVRVSRSPRHDLDVEDLQQEGRMALLEAARRFDPLRERRLSSYAVMRVRHEMSRAVWSGGSVIRLPERVHRRMDGIYKGKLLADASDAQLALLLETVGLDEEAGDECAIESVLDRRRARTALPRALATLSSRERFVVERRFFEEETFEAVGERMGVTRQRVMQLQQRAVDKLRACLLGAADRGSSDTGGASA